jgi:hypothetical protein
MLSRRKWRSAAIALLAAFSVVFASQGQAFAVSGEWDYYNPEIVNGNQQLYATGTPAEARNNGNLISVWRSNDDQGAIWFARNNGPAVRFSGQTWDSPTVVAWGDNGFAVFHTGQDNHIYYTTSSDGGVNWSFWYPVPGQTTPYTVSVTQLGAGSHELYMVYHSASDTGMWGTWFDGYNWHAAQNMGGSTYHSPAVSFNPVTHQIVAVHTGTDSQVYMNYQDYGAGTWRNWSSIGGTINGAPSIASSSTGGMLVAGTAYNGRVWSRTFNPWGYPTSDWSLDPVVNAYTGWAVFLAVNAASIYLMMTNLYTHGVYYKQAYNGN